MLINPFLLSSEIFDEAVEADGSPYQYKYVAREEEFCITALESGHDMKDHECDYRHEQESHEYGVEYLQKSVTHMFFI